VNKATLPEIRILLVEDNPPDVRWFALVLEEAGLHTEVINAPTGKAGWVELEIACANGTPPNIIFLDLNLPVFDGAELLSRIRSDRRFNGIPVCVLTGSVVEREHLLREFGMPDEAYILKPLQPDSLARAFKSFPGLRHFLLRNQISEGKAGGV